MLGANGLTVVADYAADDPLSPFPALDVVLVPGGEGLMQMQNVGAVFKWLGGDSFNNRTGGGSSHYS